MIFQFWTFISCPFSNFQKQIWKNVEKSECDHNGKNTDFFILKLWLLIFKYLCEMI
jgi:hypothetical protein